MLNPDPTQIITTLHHNDRVANTYNETYLNDDYCGYDHQKEHEAYLVKPKVPEKVLPTGNQWRSPSDVMIEDGVALKPPFTSRITRGTTHEGILGIGDGVMETEHNKFLKYVASLIEQSDLAWAHIQEQEKMLIRRRLKEMYDKIFLTKSQIMQSDVSNFIESSLQEMEDHIKDEVKTSIMSAHCNIISDLNTEMRTKLKKEKYILENALRKKYNEEVKKIEQYYELLLQNEKYRSNRLINQSLTDRNDALKAFYKMMEADKNTSTMYMMCTERKKCKVKKFFYENFHTNEVKEQLKKLNEKQEILDDYLERKKCILDLNREWEDKVQKILQLFLKFISFSLKLLPEQTSFLLDLEKLVVLQLNEIQKHPEMAPSILVDKEDITNLLKFDEQLEEEQICEGGPFVIEGDLSPSISTSYASQETIPPKLDLLSFRVQRQFIYAKCQKLDEVRKLMESQRCRCHDPSFYKIKTTFAAVNETQVSHSTVDSFKTQSVTSIPSPSVGSSLESYLIPDMQRLHECPNRGCQSFKRRMSFPNLASYLDYDEVNYTRVKAILGDVRKMESPPEVIRTADIAMHKNLPFAATEPFTINVETQYSSQEGMQPETLECPCFGEFVDHTKCKVGNDVVAETLAEKLFKRQVSLRRLIRENPRLLEIFYTYESFKANT